MPSLRRSFSSPTVRSSPYPPSHNSPTARSRQFPRRSSGSATAERRVLADIEWWRVHDGQCDNGLEQEAASEQDAGVPLGGIVTLSTGGGSREQAHSFALDSMQYDAFAALSVAPYTPPGSPHGRDSSVDSTPEMSTALLETIQLGTASCPLDDLFSFPSSPTRVGGRPIHSLFGSRSISAPGLSYHTPDFADMGGDSFSLDQNLFQ